MEMGLNDVEEHMVRALAVPAVCTERPDYCGEESEGSSCSSDSQEYPPA